MQQSPLRPDRVAAQPGATHNGDVRQDHRLGVTPAGPTRWTNGWFFDPEDRKTYNLSAQLQSVDTMAARIYKGVSLFGRTEILNRIPPRSLGGWC